MVVLAVVVRSSIDDDDGARRPTAASRSCARPSSPMPVRRSDADVTVTVQDPGDTVAALVGGDLGDGVDGWFTSNAWLEVARSRAPDGLSDLRPVASTTTAVLVDDDRAARRDRTCAARPVLALPRRRSRQAVEHPRRPTRLGRLEDRRSRHRDRLGPRGPGRRRGRPLRFHGLRHQRLRRCRLPRLAQPARGPTQQRRRRPTRGAGHSAGRLHRCRRHRRPGSQPGWRRDRDRCGARAHDPGRPRAVRGPGSRCPPPAPRWTPCARQDGTNRCDGVPRLLKPGVLAALLTLWMEVVR